MSRKHLILKHLKHIAYLVIILEARKRKKYIYRTAKYMITKRNEDPEFLIVFREENPFSSKYELSGSLWSSSKPSSEFTKSCGSH